MTRVEITVELQNKANNSYLRLKLSYFGNITQRPNSVKESIMLGKVKGSRRQPAAKWMYSITEMMGVSLGDLKGQVEDILEKINVYGCKKSIVIWRHIINQKANEGQLYNFLVVFQAFYN